MEKSLSCIDIIQLYQDKYNFIHTNKLNEFWAMERLFRIGIPEEVLNSKEPKYVFRVLHEIGHCETFHEKQFKVQREFLATQWAIDKCKELQIQPDKNHDLWQHYILQFTKAKDKSKYILKW